MGHKTDRLAPESGAAEAPELSQILYTCIDRSNLVKVHQFCTIELLCLQHTKGDATNLNICLVREIYDIQILVYDPQPENILSNTIIYKHMLVQDEGMKLN
jgi:hypothetical protein